MSSIKAADTKTSDFAKQPRFHRQQKANLKSDEHKVCTAQVLLHYINKQTNHYSDNKKGEPQLTTRFYYD